MMTPKMMTPKMTTPRMMTPKMMTLKMMIWIIYDLFNTRGLNLWRAHGWMEVLLLEVSVLKIVISVFHNSFAFYLFSFNIAISSNSKYATSVCDNSTFLAPLHFMLSATQDNKQIIYLMCVLFYFIF